MLKRASLQKSVIIVREGIASNFSSSGFIDIYSRV